MSLSSRSRMRMRSARNQERGCVFLRLLSPTRKTPASIFRRLPRWCNPCESCPMNHWQWDPRSSLRMRLRILLEGSFVFACWLLPTPCAKMPFCLSAPAHCWKQPYPPCQQCVLYGLVCASFLNHLAFGIWHIIVK